MVDGVLWCGGHRVGCIVWVGAGGGDMWLVRPGWGKRSRLNH